MVGHNQIGAFILKLTARFLTILCLDTSVARQLQTTSQDGTQTIIILDK
jgi:hypothetical protein